MAEVNDLHDFIADCEWRTRKILRESNKKMKESARLLAAKERLELLKQKGGKKIVAESPSAVTETKVHKSSQSLSDGNVISNAFEWKGRDKIIHDACETINSLSGDDVVSSKKSNQVKAQKEKTRNKLHASLCASPFHNASKGTQASAATKTVASCRSDHSGNAAPAMVTRRTIERDFYIMSKNRTKPMLKRLQRSSESEYDKPELKSSVLWKKYRCDDTIMESKRKHAEILFRKFEQLRSFDDTSDNSEQDAANSCDKESTSSSSEEEEEERAHALHNLLNAHVADENRRSQRRTNKMLAQMIFKPDVQSMWNQSESHASLVKSESQLQSVSLQKATKKFIAAPMDQSTPIRELTNIDPSDANDISPYISPYNERGSKLHLINNEPLILSSLERTVPFTISISYEFVSPSKDACRSDDVWVYEIYDPCDGSILTYTLNESEVKMLKSLCIDPTMNSVKQYFQKIVHLQEVQQDSSSFSYAVMVSVDGIKISATIHRSRGQFARDFDATCLDEYFEPLCTLQVCEILQLLGKHHVHRLLDESFWMSETNGHIIWIPIIDIISKDAGILLSEKSVLSRSILAYDSLIGLKRAMDTADGNEIIQGIFFGVCQDRKCQVAPIKSVERIPPLSMRISNHSPYSSTLCPGHAVFGKQGLWRLSQPITDEESNSLFPVWSSAAEVKYLSNLDTSQATAFIYSKNLGPNKGTSVTALSRLAFESPVRTPYCRALDRGYIVPPFSQHELVNGITPTIKLPRKSLLESLGVSMLDTFLPSPVIMLDPSATEGDWIDAPQNCVGNVCHTRYDHDFDKGGFRTKAYAHQIEYDDSIKSVVYGISEKAAIPNSPSTTPFVMHKSTECCTQLLSKERTATDYRYIAESKCEGTLNVPYLFTTHMKAYKPILISRKSVISYQDEEKFLLATREAEANKAELALKIKAAEKIAEARLHKRMEEVYKSMKLCMTIASDGDSCADVDSTVDCKAIILASCHETSGDLETHMPSNTSAVAKDCDDLDQTAQNNNNFVCASASKLNVPDQRLEELHCETTSSEINQQASGCDEQPILQISSSANSTQHRPIVSKLRLDCQKCKEQKNVVRLKGDGWKRLPRADTLIGELNLTTRKVQKNWRGAKSNGVDGRTNFFSVSAVDATGYNRDPEIFNVKTKTMFISDLTTERLRLSKSKRQQKQYEESLLSDDQKFSLHEILQIPVSESPSKRMVIEINEHDSTRLDDDGILAKTETKHKSAHNGSNTVEFVNKAILAVKNHNMQQLEYILDTEGISIETCDQHGNTLFILACQQGSKKLAKFLLRRGADINAQNNSGNTALHYLHEYHHTTLAEYLLRKGANDSLQNAEGLTVYEGVHQESNNDR